jgi:hypothetical protein
MDSTVGLQEPIGCRLIHPELRMAICQIYQVAGLPLTGPDSWNGGRGGRRINAIMEFDRNADFRDPDIGGTEERLMRVPVPNSAADVPRFGQV